MKVIHTVAALQAELSARRAEGKSVGLVPTMGALHAGHASLVDRSVKENDVTVVSVFVNPTQFNDPNDLQKYPRTLEADCALLEQHGAAIAFAPSVEEVYPEPDTRQFSYAPLDTVMEGKYRPGHFNGVCQVVSKLFDMVKPDRAYFGEKDFQQLAIVREMVRHASRPNSALRPCKSRRRSSPAWSMPRRTPCPRRSSSWKTASRPPRGSGWNISPWWTATRCRTYPRGMTAPTSWVASPSSAGKSA